MPTMKKKDDEYGAVGGVAKPAAKPTQPTPNVSAMTGGLGAGESDRGQGAVNTGPTAPTAGSERRKAAPPPDIRNMTEGLGAGEAGRGQGAVNQENKVNTAVKPVAARPPAGPPPRPSATGPSNGSRSTGVLDRTRQVAPLPERVMMKAQDLAAARAELSAMLRPPKAPPPPDPRLAGPGPQAIPPPPNPVPQKPPPVFGGKSGPGAAAPAPATVAPTSTFATPKAGPGAAPPAAPPPPDPRLAGQMQLSGKSGPGAAPAPPPTPEEQYLAAMGLQARTGRGAF